MALLFLSDEERVEDGAAEAGSEEHLEAVEDLQAEEQLEDEVFETKSEADERRRFSIHSLKTFRNLLNLMFFI